MFTRIDHVMICVPDLAHGIEQYRKMGFKSIAGPRQLLLLSMNHPKQAPLRFLPGYNTNGDRSNTFVPTEEVQQCLNVRLHYLPPA
jgi:hypothetical protein